MQDLKPWPTDFALLGLKGSRVLPNYWRECGFRSKVSLGTLLGNRITVVCILHNLGTFCLVTQDLLEFNPPILLEVKCGQWLMFMIGTVATAVERRDVTSRRTFVYIGLAWLGLAWLGLG